jgi:hypothetical protein
MNCTQADDVRKFGKYLHKSRLRGENRIRKSELRDEVGD